MSELDQTMPIETFSDIEQKYIEASIKLITKYKLPYKGFIDELQRRLKNEEILEEPDITK